MRRLQMQSRKPRDWRRKPTPEECALCRRQMDFKDLPGGWGENFTQGTKGDECDDNEANTNTYRG